jgi:hypothetical protein
MSDRNEFMTSIVLFEMPMSGWTYFSTLKMYDENVSLLFLWRYFFSFVGAGAAPSANSSTTGFFSVGVFDVGVLAAGVFAAGFFDNILKMK